MMELIILKQEVRMVSLKPAQQLLMLQEMFGDRTM